MLPAAELNAATERRRPLSSRFPRSADGDGLDLLQQAKDLLWRAEAGERKFAERGEFTAAMPREFARSKYRTPQPTGQLLHARRQIDGLADAGEMSQGQKAGIIRQGANSRRAYWCTGESRR